MGDARERGADKRPVAEVAVLFADEHLAVVDKPPGLLVVPAPGRRGPTLIDLLGRQLGARVFAVHRLDEDTSGVLVVARTDVARVALEAVFRAHAAERIYRAVTARAPSPLAGRIESRLREGPDGVVRSARRGEDGERAVTEYRLLERHRRHALLECRLETGRRNQIRAHLAELGCPIVGDRKYGWRRQGADALQARRPLLHAWHVRFVHPLTGTELAVCAVPAEPALRARTDPPA
ncbi:MAG: RluA family pseudouridine synthase [Planctomycetes bacterium]|nr:RluA family pseudouridine synthase [Planctomycetota bacterium]